MLNIVRRVGGWFVLFCDWSIYISPIITYFPVEFSEIFYISDTFGLFKFQLFKIFIPVKVQLKYLQHTIGSPLMELLTGPSDETIYTLVVH